MLNNEVPNIKINISQLFDFEIMKQKGFLVNQIFIGHQEILITKYRNGNFV